MEEDNIKYQIMDTDSELYNIQKQESAPVVIPNNPTITIDQIIQQYVEKNNPTLYILTPCFGCMCFVNYVHCIMNTRDFFKKHNFPLQIEFCKNDSLISRARNNLVAKALVDPRCTHIMFIDNDISWDPMDIMKLILSEKELIGGIYPLKRYDWSKLTKPDNRNIIDQLIAKKNDSILSNIVSDELMIQHNLLNYNINYIDNCLQINNNTAKVKHLATGFMMIRREVFTKMIKEFPQTKYVDDVNFLKPEENEFAYALFDCGVHEGHYFSEDWLFCDRWSKMGESIWMDVSIVLIHSGVEDYKGCYLSTII